MYMFLPIKSTLTITPRIVKIHNKVKKNISDAFEAKTTILQLQEHNRDNSCRKRKEMIYFQFFFKQ